MLFLQGNAQRPEQRSGVGQRVWRQTFIGVFGVFLPVTLKI